MRPGGVAFKLADFNFRLNVELLTYGNIGIEASRFMFAILQLSGVLVA